MHPRAPLGPTLRTVRVAAAATLTLAVTVPALAQTNAFDARRIDMRPLLQVQAFGTTIAAKPIEVDLFLYRGGGVVLASSVAGELGSRSTTDNVERGLGNHLQVAGLNGAFLQNHILQQSGGCGTPAPDYIEHYTLTYYGQKNSRQFTVGGDFQTCPSETRDILDAVCLYLWQTLESPIEYCPPPNNP